jgi:hypothetical protein
MKRLWRWFMTCPPLPDDTPPLDKVALLAGIRYPCC